MAMKKQLHITPPNDNNDRNNAMGFSSFLLGTIRRRKTAFLASVATAILFAAQTSPADPPQGIGTVFVIAMENHNFTQPPTQTNPQPILGNPAAPYMNSLITPGNPNAAQVSFARAYFNSGTGVHPSEPNYVWAEAGSDFGIHTDADPSSANHNIFDAPHLTRQLNAAGVPWNNYQEDVQFAASAIHSAAGTSTTLIKLIDTVRREGDPQSAPENRIHGPDCGQVQRPTGSGSSVRIEPERVAHRGVLRATDGRGTEC